MKTYPIHNESNTELNGFEVNNTFLGRNGAVKIIENIPESRVLKKPNFLSWFKEDVFCEFEINNKLFIILEAFGDNSRYFIAKNSSNSNKELNVVHEAFKNS